MRQSFHRAVVLAVAAVCSAVVGLTLFQGPATYARPLPVITPTEPATPTPAGATATAGGTITTIPSATGAPTGTATTAPTAGTATSVPTTGPTEEPAPAPVSPPRADPAVSIRSANPSGQIGELIRYTIVVTNTGPTTARNVSVENVLPPGLGLWFATPSRGLITVIRNQTGMTILIEDVSPGDFVVVESLAQVQAPQQQNNLITAQLTTSSAGNNTANDLATLPITVRQ